jgi:hypothetical protein
MATITTTQSFTTGDQVTAGTLNGIATNSAFDTSVVDDSSTVLTTNASGTANSRIIVKDGGITPAKLSTGGPNWSTSLGYGNLIITSLNGADSVTIFSTDANQSGFNIGGDADGEGLATILYDRSLGALIFRNGSFPSAGEAMRINSAGTLLVGTTSTSPVVNRSDGVALFETGLVEVQNTNAISLRLGRDTGVGSVADFRYNGSTVGTISVGTSSTAFNTSSDYRLKQGVTDIEDSISKVQSLKPVNFAWKVDGTRSDGFLAHEAQEVVPEAVTGTKDAVNEGGEPEYQCIDQSKLVPLLTKALQESLTKIESLEARVAALES